MAPKYVTIQRHIETWRRKKAIYDRHIAGETYVAIARSLDVPTHNVMRHGHDWQDQLEYYAKYLQERAEYSDSKRQWRDNYFLPLINDGLIGDEKDIPHHMHEEAEAFGVVFQDRIIAIKAIMQNIEQKQISLREIVRDMEKDMSALKREIGALGKGE